MQFGDGKIQGVEVCPYGSPKQLEKRRRRAIERAIYAIEDKPLPLYGDGLVSRDWIHVEDHCEAILLVVEKGKVVEIYNIGAGDERTNLEVVRFIVDRLGKPRDLIKLVIDRPGHDRRYALDASKMRMTFQWRPRHSFEEGLEETILR